MSVISFPGLETYRPWEAPVAPFQWRRIDTGPVVFEFLYDANGKQVFNRNSAIIRKAGTTEILWPEPENKNEGGAG